MVSNKPIVAKTTEGYQSIYRSTSETIMPFIPVICLYFGDGICPKAYGVLVDCLSRRAVPSSGQPGLFEYQPDSLLRASVQSKGQHHQVGASEDLRSASLQQVYESLLS